MRTLDIRFPKLGTLLAAGALMIAVPSQASVIATASVNEGSQASSVVDTGTVVGKTATAAAHTSGDTHATASATYGVLKVTTNGSTSSGASNGGAQAKFSDHLKLENAALAGKQGRVTLAYQFDYDAWVDASGDGFANGSVSFLAWANNSYAWFLDYLNTDTAGYTMYEYRDPNGQGRTYGVPRTNILYVTTDFVWGNHIATSFELQTSVGTYVPNPGRGGAASYNFDAGNSAYWAGIVSATADGELVNDYLLTSLSGTDYSRSFVPAAAEVPEPATAAVFLFGLALLGLQRARRQ